MHEKLVESAWEEACSGKGQSILCTYTNYAEISRFLDNIIKRVQPNCKLLRAKPSLDNHTPFYPFLDWIYDQTKSFSLHTFSIALRKARIYPLHRSLFLADVTGMYGERDEEIITEELTYEQSQMRQSIWKLFLYTHSTSPIVIILEDIHNFPVSTMYMLTEIYALLQKNKILLISTINEKQKVKGIVMRKAWSRFYACFSSFSSNLRFYSESTKLSYKPRKKGISFNSSILKRLAHFLCLEDCRYLKEEYSIQIDAISENCKIDLLETFADVYFLQKDYEEALLLFRMLLNSAKKENNVCLIATIYRKIGLIFYYKNNLSEAKKFALQSLKLAQQLKKETHIFYALSLLLLINPRDPVYPDHSQWKAIYRYILELGKKLSLINNLCFWLSRHDPLDHLVEYPEIEDNISQAIYLSKKNANKFRLANAYHSQGYVCLLQGKIEDVYKLYHQSERLRKKIGNHIQIAYITNALGYFMHQRSEYDKAMKYFQKALNASLKAKDFHEVGMVLCNIAINLFFCLQYSQAIDFLEQAVQLMEVIGIKNYAFHSHLEINTLVAAASLLVENSVKAYEKIATISHHEKVFSRRQSTRQEEVLLYTLLQALVKEYEGDITMAYSLFSQQKQTLYRDYKIISYRIPFFLLHYGNFLHRIGLTAEAVSIWKEGFAESKKQKNAYFQGLLGKLLHMDRTLDVKPPKTLRCDFERILDTAKVDADLQKFHKIMNDVDYLHSFQQLADKYYSIPQLIKKSLELINATFLADSVIFSLKEKDGWKQLEELYTTEVSWKMSVHDSNLPEYLHFTYPRGAIIECQYDTRLKKLPFRQIIHIPLGEKEQVKAHLFCSSFQTDTINTHEVLNILTISGRYLMGTLEKLRKDRELQAKKIALEQANMKLQKMATTDILTGLNNRIALVQRLSDEQKRLQRYGEGKCFAYFSIIFIDLDNFKYYNDHFGHTLGDVILQEFGKLLRFCTRTVDFSVRYGGDEFVIVLPEISASEALRVARRISESLSKCKGFKELIEKYTGVPQKIPQQKQLSCSIGISHLAMGSRVSGEELLQQADIALYEAKNAGKNCIRIYKGG